MAIIAVYESDDLMYGLLCEWLRGAGYLVRDSARIPDRQMPRADLVILSVSGSKREIEPLIRGVRSVHPDAPVVALSSQVRLGLSSNGVLARELGVARLLAKPLTRRELVAAVDTVLAEV